MKAKILCMLCLILLVTIACSTAAFPAPDPTAAATFTSLPSTRTVTGSPTASVTPEAHASEPPACTFPLAQTTTAESTPEKYTFSKPKVVLTAPKGGYYDIIEWLPDNQQILMTEFITVESATASKQPQQSIDLYNSETGKSTTYAIRPLTYEPPSWLPELNAIVYPVMSFLGIDKNAQRGSFTRQVWVSYGKPDTAQMLADNLSQTPLAVKPDGSEIVYLSDAKILKRDDALKELPFVSFDPNHWDYAQKRRDKNPVSYEMAWQPGSSLIFLYSMGGGELGGGYTFMLDTDTGRVCELDMGGWAYRARWSSNGRYLAIDRSTVYVGFTNVTDLVVLDTQTGNLSTLEIVSPDVEGKHYVNDFTWAPDNRHLLTLEDIPSTYDPYRTETIHHELYLVDFMSGENIHLFPEFKSFVADSAPTNNFAWSPDGSNLLIRCPTNIVDRICLISVKSTAQP